MLPVDWIIWNTHWWETSRNEKDSIEADLTRNCYRRVHGTRPYLNNFLVFVCVWENICSELEHFALEMDQSATLLHMVNIWFICILFYQFWAQVPNCFTSEIQCLSLLIICSSVLVKRFNNILKTWWWTNWSETCHQCKYVMLWHYTLKKLCGLCYIKYY
jgi:hypothetical protein